MADRLKVAVVTGRHPYDVIGFHAAFRSIPDADTYIQHMEDWSTASREVREGYDVVVFYNMHGDLPPDDAPWYEAGTRAALEQLGETNQGIVALHHALLAFPRWELWSELVGLNDRSFGYHMGQTVRVQVADPGHPITQGLSDWEMVDETYTTADAGEGSRILLTTDHPRSMRTLAWTRQFRNARVFCFQCGHDNTAYAHPSFREVLARGIRWTAGRL